MNIKVFYKLIKIIFFSIIIGGLLEIAVFTISTENIRKNVIASTKLLANETVSPQDELNRQRDNFTDSLMLLSAMDSNNKSLIDRAMKVYRLDYFPNYFPYASLLRYKNTIGQTEVSYARYWHGYLVILKPLLYFFTYENVRKILQCTNLILVYIVFLLLLKNNISYLFIPYIATIYLFSNPFYVGLSLQYSWAYLISQISLIIFLVKYKKWSLEKNIIFFLIIGIITTFMDISISLLFPISFCLCFYIFLHSKDKPLNNLKNLFLFLVSWGIGVSFMWYGKWGIATILTDENVLLDAYKNILYRISREDNQLSFSIKDVIISNISIFTTPLVIYITSGIIAITSVCIIKHKQEGYLLSILLSLSPLIILPFIWYSILANHSYIHYWMTYKQMAMSYLSIIGAFCHVCFYSEKHKKE